MIKKEKFEIIKYLEKNKISENLKGRDFLKLLDFSTEEILFLVQLSEQLKKEKKQGISHRVLQGKNIALIFEKTSTRTRCAFEVAGYDLGMNVTYLDSQDGICHAHKLAKKKALLTQQVCLQVCLTELSTEDMVKALWRSLQSTQKCLFGMA